MNTSPKTPRTFGSGRKPQNTSTHHGLQAIHTFNLPTRRREDPKKTMTAYNPSSDILAGNDQLVAWCDVVRNGLATCKNMAIDPEVRGLARTLQRLHLAAINPMHQARLPDSAGSDQIKFTRALSVLSDE